jgi:hypothetical protein
MSAPSPPPDNSLQVEQMRQNAAKEKDAQDRADAEAKAQKLAGLRQTSRDSAGQSVNDYFSSQGIDPTGYSGSISQKLNSILSGISPDDANPGAAFTDAGSTIFGDLQTAERNKAVQGLDSIFAPNWEVNKVPYTLDDPYANSLKAEQRQSADSILRNMLDRGVITSSGFSAGEADLDKQDAGVSARLDSLGLGILNDERNALTGISNKARQQASTLKLGQHFDPYTFQGEADQNFGDFISHLSDSLKAKVGTGNLFSTAGLAGIAGAAQGAQNTAFDPTAAAGVIDPNDKKTNTATTPTGTESVF